MLVTVTGSGITPRYHQDTPLGFDPFGFERCSSVATSSPPPFTGPFPVLVLVAYDRHWIEQGGPIAVPQGSCGEAEPHG